jgi:ferrous iron transport protein B
MSNPLHIIIAGNPNCGKSTIFNAITGARQHVGNYAGVTVEKKTGSCTFAGRDLEVIDLPGTYCLTAYSAEELVARNEIVHGRSGGVVVNVVDASNLERHLYLTMQLLEMKVPLVVALNMADVAEQRGRRVDVAGLSEHLGVPVISTVGSRGGGIPELLTAVLGIADGTIAATPAPVPCPAAIEAELTGIQAAVAAELARPAGDLRWLAIKLLEGDAEIRGRFPGASPALAVAQASAERLQQQQGQEAGLLLAASRYDVVTHIDQAHVQRLEEHRYGLSDRIDRFVLHPWLGPVILLLVMYLVFWLTFVLGARCQDGLEFVLAWVKAWLSSCWPEAVAGDLHRLFIDGVVSGVGSVLVFLPNIVILFCGIAFLEDSGYMARAAFLMERIMRRVGLHGKSFMPLLTGFGCTVPAVMAARTLENPRDRLVTILVTPLMSCGARIPIYALLIPAFFPERWQALMMVGVYLVGVALALTGALILRRTAFRGKVTPLMMELPPYHRPTTRNLLMHMWDRAGEYVRKAATLLLAVSVVLWALQNYPRKTVFSKDYAMAAVQIEKTYATQMAAQPETAKPLQAEAAAAQRQLRVEKLQEEAAYTIAGRAGTVLQPFFAPLGFDSRIGTALIGAFAAKEVFVTQLGIAFGMEEDQKSDSSRQGLRAQLRQAYTPLQGLCVMLFCLISMPCISTFIITGRETGSWKWPVLQLLGLTSLAYAIVFSVYHAGLLLGLGA